MWPPFEELELAAGAKRLKVEDAGAWLLSCSLGLHYQ